MSFAEPAGLLLEAHVVTLRFGGLHAADAVSAQFRAGELVGIIGPNGAGKTTPLKALAGLIPRGGGVTLDGADRPDKTRQIVRGGAALVGEGRQLFAQMTVAENLELGGWLTKAP